MERKMQLGKNTLFKSITKHWEYYLLALPGILYFIVFKYVPMYGVTIAFKDYSIYKGIMESPWVGMKVFERLFRLAGFERALGNTVILSLMKLLTGFPAAILVAMLLNELRSRKFSKYVQTSMLLPHFVSWIVVYALAYALFSPNIGLIKDIYALLAPNAKVPNLLADKYSFRWFLTILSVWKGAGFSSIMFTAAIAGIDPQIYESAELDGAGRFKQAIHVTLPCIRNTIIIMWILRLGSIMDSDFEQVLAFQNVMTLATGDTIDTFVYRMGLKQAEYSLATAAGLFKSLIGMVFVLGSNWIIRRVEPESALM